MSADVSADIFFIFLFEKRKPFRTIRCEDLQQHQQRERKMSHYRITALKAALSANATSPLVQMARGELQALTVNTDDTAYEFIVKVFDRSKSSHDKPNGELMYTLYLDQHEVSDAIDHYSKEDIYIKTVYIGEE